MIEDIKPKEGFDPEIGLLLAAWEDSTREWRENFTDATVETLSYKVVEAGASAGALMLHMIECDIAWIERILMGMELDPEEMAMLKSEEIQQDDGIFPDAYLHPIEWYYNLMDSTRARLIEHLRNLDSADVRKSRGGYEFSVRWVLSHLVQHDSYHGGQAVLLNELAKRSLALTRS